MSLDLMNPLVQDALTVYAEAVTLVKECKGSRAYSLLHDGGGSFVDALESEEVPTRTSEWLENLRATLCEDMY